MKLNIETLKRISKLLKILISRKITLGGANYNINPIFSWDLVKELTNSSYEDDVLYLVKIVLKNRTGAFIDVGANVGQTLVALLSLDPEIDYYGFEPQLGAIKEIDSFKSKNMLSNVNIFPFAVSDKIDVMTLQFTTATDRRASLEDSFRPSSAYTTSAKVLAVSIDQIWKAIGDGQIAIIKIDVEGGELKVFEGLFDTLSRHKPPVIFEVLPDYLTHSKSELDPEIVEVRKISYAKIHKILVSHDYQIYYIDQNITPIKVREDEEFRRGTRETINYFAAHKDDAILKEIDKATLSQNLMS